MQGIQRRETKRPRVSYYANGEVLFRGLFHNHKPVIGPSDDVYSGLNPQTGEAGISKRSAFTPEQIIGPLRAAHGVRIS
jgi:hypothetical protein